jgi:hypothetical protein
MTYLHFAFLKNKSENFNFTLYEPFIAGSGEHFINNTVDLSLELETYDKPAEKLLLLKKAITEFEYLNIFYKQADPSKYEQVHKVI